MKKLKLLMAFLLLGVTTVSWAQTQISGVVVDEANIPLPGASVLVKGTNNGVVSDFDGNFTISIADSDKLLVVSYIGYETKEIPLGSSSDYTIQLIESSTGLDEVVVIGYGSVKKSDLTGAVASLNTETLTEQKKTDIGQAIQGRVAGVDVRTLSSKPGAPLSIKIRGNTVVTNNNAGRDGVSDDLADDLSKPLYVVDGIFFEDINVLNPADIEQMDILKDASATAIYGSRGANGVVIITTKNGIEGKTVFTYDSSFGLRTATNVPDLFDGPEYVQFVDDVLRARAWGGTGSAADYNNVAIDRSTEFQSSNEEASNVANGRYTDWMGLYQKAGIQTSHTLGMSGGTNGLVYNASLGYLNDEGVMGIEGYERYNISASVSKKVSDQVTVGVKAYLALSEREEGSRELFRSTLRLAPTVNPFDAEGEPILFPDDQDLRFVHPIYDAQGAWQLNTKSLNVIANVFLNYKPTKWLNFKTQFAPNITTQRFGEYRGLLTKSSRNDPSRIQSHYQSDFNTAYTWDNILDFDFDIAPDHNLKTTIISSIYYNNKEGSNIQVRDFDTDAYLFYNTEGGNDIRDFDSFYQKETLASFAGRLNYSIKDRYLFTFTGRYDGSSKLSAGNKWNFFPSAAFAWRASQESFLQNADWLNNLKFRVSYGEAGNDSTVGAYSSLAFLSPSNYLFGENPGVGKTIAGLPNEDLTWEVSKEYNLGMDLSILNNRVGLSFEYYNKKTEGSILARTLSNVTGYEDALGNFGSVRNSGIEVTLNTVNVKTDNFSWRTNFNYTKNTNEIEEIDGDLDEIPFGNHGVLKIGAPVDAIWNTAVAGIWQIDEAAEAATYGDLPGQYKFVDQNNDGTIDQDDKVLLGQNSPDWIGGMTNTFNYKNLELNVQVYTRQGSYGHSEFFQNFSTSGDGAVFNSLDLDYWTPNNPNGAYPIPDYGGTGWTYEDLSFVRVGNIGLGYQFPQELADKLKMSRLKMSLDIQNPFTFTDYKGPDPETALQNSYNMTYAVKTVLLGLKLAF
ncbi:SusC/RagA family TonB-linked outer membrane protein [Zobellia nedashkovskayae]|uniref:SusC/RagA family TonB-linked outer membrane protein n=1 Tax=Zobellia nedashkovskayae TaxID=2779510 RepID=UPI00188B2359|nr:TonB-dependent receptor [Zobellia nedashkovskayae]